jgi:guanylate kinase
LCRADAGSAPRNDARGHLHHAGTRPGEQDGIDYYFLDAETFLKRVQAGDFLEHATVHGNSYGTLKSEVLGKLRAGHDILLNVDVQGAAAIRAQAEADAEIKRALVTVFLAPSSLGVLEERLRKRGKDSPDVIQKRLSAARQEIAHWTNFDYVIVSGLIKEDLRRMQAILDAEQMKQRRTRLPSTSDRAWERRARGGPLLPASGGRISVCCNRRIEPPEAWLVTFRMKPPCAPGGRTMRAPRGSEIRPFPVSEELKHFRHPVRR